MKKMMKHLYAILLVVVLVATLLPTSVFASPGKGHGRGKNKQETITETVVETEASAEEAAPEETIQEETSVEDIDSLTSTEVLPMDEASDVSEDESLGTDNAEIIDVQAIVDEISASVDQPAFEEGEVEDPAEEIAENEAALASLFYNGGSYTIELIAGTEMQFPEGASLVVSEIEAGTEEYQAYCDQAKEALVAENSIDSAAELTFARFFDIKIQTSEGIFEPDESVQVKITYLDNPEIEYNDEVKVVHFPENGNTEVIDTTVDAFSASEAVGGEAIEVAFEQGSFSVTGTVVAKLQDNWPNAGNYVLVVNKQGSSDYYAVSHSGTLLPVTYNSAEGTVTFESFLTTDEVSDYWWTLSNTRNSYYKRLNNSNVYIDPWYDTGLANSNNVYLYKTTEGYIRDYHRDNYVTVDTDSMKIGGNGSSSNAAVFMFANSFHVDTTPAPSGDDEDLGEPGHEKKLTDNKDGTYTLSLSVVGDSKAKTESTKADVIVILDTSGSMRFDSDDEDVTDAWGNYNYNYNGYTDSRIYKARQALSVLTTELLKNNEKDPEAIRLSLITFNTTSGNPSALTDSYEAFMSGVPNVTSNQQVRNIQGGTNWEAALAKASSVQTRTGASKYVIFVSDGNPTFRNTKGDYTNPTPERERSQTAQTNGVWGSGQEDEDHLYSVVRCYDNAVDDARALVESGFEFYTLGIFGTLHRMANLCAAAYDSETYPANHHQTAADLDAMKAAFAKIIDEINKNFSYTGVSIEDGMTDMTAQTEIQGTAGNFQYKVTDENGNEVTVENLPNAQFTEGKVVWSLGSNYKLEKGYTYTVSFVVWPDQDAYDLVADLNNGLKSYSDLTDKQKAAIKNVEGVYSLKTNTDANLTYQQITTITNPDGSTSESVSDPKTAEFVNPDPVGLKGTSITIKKDWADELQSSIVEALIKAAEEEGKRFEITLDVMKGTDTEPYMTYKFAPEKDETTGKYTWPSQSLSIAPGVMISQDKATASGLDTTKYTKVTGDDGKTYYVLDEGHDYSVVERDFSDYHFDFVPGNYHPMLVDGVLKDIEPTYASGKMTSFKVKEAELTTFKGTNTLRGGINLTKNVFGKDGKTAYDTEDTFVFEVTLTNDNAVFTGVNIPWFGVKYDGENSYNYYHDAEGKYIPESVTGDTDGDGLEDDGNIPAVSDGNKTASFTVELGAKDSMRLNNVPLGTKYTITEKAVKGYSLFGIDQVTALNDGADQKPGTGTVTIPDRKIEGTIVPNRANNITFKNKISDEAFYVYHSSDVKIEKIFFADSRVIKELKNNDYEYTFNIVNEAKTGSIYGGYYKGYGNTTSTDEDIKALTYDQEDTATKYTYATKSATTKNWASDSNGKKYVGDFTSWNKDKAYTVSGTDMNPEAGKVYYLKEVPDVYLEPAVYTVYDTHDADESGFYQIKKLYQMTATDDGNYKETGFDVTTSTGINDSGSFIADFCWGEKIDIKKDGATIKTLTAGDLVSKHTGLIAGRDITGKYIVANAYYREIPYHVTLDNVKVTSVKRMIVYLRNTRWKDWTKPGMTKIAGKVNPAYAALKGE